ncbi:hypothetical protein [Beijerinckia sp. L45]|uniref:hypothetical protein n=1 Tax=Beijerinckia sp. L45 TaxID=1641855 RepID=UPI00131E6C40|nr:hypothetical protein [Beijerinckia sp. L45]
MADGPDPASWTRAFAANTLPAPVLSRLRQAGEGRLPWTSTMMPAELLAARTHGITPIATVSGTCWYMFGRSWTEGHAEGWRVAIGRMVLEARSAGANAIVDVKLRTVYPSQPRSGLAASGMAASMDFTVVGTAVRVEGLSLSPDPIVATVSTLEFVRLLEAGIVPVGVATGAKYEWLTPSRMAILTGNYGTTMNTAYTELGAFWENIRTNAIAALRAEASTMGNGVLAHTHFGEILKQEPANDRSPPMYLGRWIIVGTVVDTPRNAKIPHDIVAVVDMRDDASPLRRSGDRRHTAYTLETEQDGAI